MAVSSAFDSEDSLPALKIAFLNFRNSSGMRRPKFPTSLQRRAVALLESGASCTAVAGACGVAPQTVRNWKEFLPPLPRKLALISDGSAHADVARIEIHSKVAALPPTFRFRLAGGVVCEASGEEALWLVRELGGEVSC